MTGLQQHNPQNQTLQNQAVANQTLQNQSDANQSNTRQFLTFTVAGEEYGVDIMTVREIKGWTETTRLPNTPTYMRGVINLRGVIVPIFDLRARFTGELTISTPKHVTIILSSSNKIVSILADAVSDILTVQAQEIKPAPDMPNSETSAIIEQRYVTGLIAIEDRMVVLLDIEKLFAIDAEQIELSG